MTGPYNKKSQGSLRRLSFFKILLVYPLRSRIIVCSELRLLLSANSNKTETSLLAMAFILRMLNPKVFGNNKMIRTDWANAQADPSL